MARPPPLSTRSKLRAAIAISPQHTAPPAAQRHAATARVRINTGGPRPKFKGQEQRHSAEVVR
ncbi:MAG: hypothetical protein INH43_24710 [Acidobacteriaceae bacterium]|nr:hypothetical protein [Acidobacteriaceae bacterium]